MSNIKESNRLEKHFTPTPLIEYMYKVMDEFIDINSITEILEPSAGDGRLIDFLKDKLEVEIKGYDIYNYNDHKDIKIKDYLKTDIEYKKGRVCFMNPPFSKGLKFLYKSLEECDHCISILSLNSFLNIDYDKYKVHTIDIFRNYEFETCKVGICIIVISRYDK